MSTRKKNYIHVAGVSILILVAIVFCYIGYIFGYKGGTNNFNRYLNNFKPLRNKSLQYQYISPLVGVDSPNAFLMGYHLDVKKEIEALADEYKMKGLVDYGVYYRELNTSIWFGINEREEFYPASLLKITIALAAYKQGEYIPGYLANKLVFTQQVKDVAVSRRNVETVLVLGNSYTVDELIRIMLVHSDNSARDLLAMSVDQKYIDMVFYYLNVNNPSASQDYSISMMDYALFFRMLYSATFINEGHSEELLGYLTKSDFSAGITRDLPIGVVVAHKYGVFNIQKTLTNPEEQELHECGIVYQDNKPYLLCVMTKGKNQTVLADFIAAISKKMFEYSLTQQ
jgi:hypothetical protein